MSGLYLLGVVALWLGLSSLLWRWLRRWRSAEGGRTNIRNGIAIVVSILWLGVSFWYAGGQKYYYDWQVNRMCAVDGGVRVYETVRLQADKFDKWGMVNFYRPNQGVDALGSVYLFNRETVYYIRKNPELFRMSTQVIRRADHKVLGESVFYKRGGGDLPGPWHGSSYMCPKLSVENDVLRQIFIKE